MTIRECLDISARILGGIRVPVEMTEELSVPLAGIRNNLILCINELDKRKAEQNAGEASGVPSGDAEAGGASPEGTSGSPEGDGGQVTGSEDVPGTEG